MFRKTLSAFLCVILALTLMAGCSDRQTEESAPVEITEEAESAVIPADADITTIAFTEGGAEVSGSGVSINDDGGARIAAAGYYRLTGASSAGRVIVEAAETDDVTLILDGCSITCADDEAIYIKAAANAVIMLADGSENVLVSGTEPAEDEEIVDAEEDASGAALRFKCPLTITGGGSLTVSGYINNGVGGSGDLTIDSGVILVQSVNDGLKSKSNIRIGGGELTVSSSADGIQSDGDLTITGGTLNIRTGAGAEGADMKVSDSAMFGTGGGPGEGPGGESRRRSSDEPADEADADSAAEESESDQTLDEAALDEPEAADVLDEAAPEAESDESETASEPTADDQEAEAAEAPDSGDASGEGPGDGDDNRGEASGERGDDDRDGENGSRMPWDMDDESSVSRKGLKSGGSIMIEGGSILLDAEDDAVHADGDFTISGGDLLVKSGDDGVHADRQLSITGGSVGVEQAYEGLEAKSILITDGRVKIVANDDGMNVNGGDMFGFPGASGEAEEETDAEEEDDLPAELRITGGLVVVDSGGDGLDSNGSLYIEGGEIYVSGPSTNMDAALDTGDSSDCELLITGGSLMAGGYSGMMESPESAENAQGFIYYTISDYAEDGALCELKDADGNVLLSYHFNHSYNCVVLSSPDIREGETYTLTIGGQEYTIEMTDSYFTTRGQRGSRGGSGSGEPRDEASGERGRSEASSESPVGEAPEAEESADADVDVIEEPEAAEAP